MKKQSETESKEKQMPRVSDLVASGFEDFYPKATKTTIDNVMTMGDVVILDCVIVDNFETEFGSHPLAIVAVVVDLESQDTFTFPTSGQVVVDKLRQLKAKKAMPCTGQFIKEKRYYDVK